ncbi:hypothetical protein AB0C81_03985 [Streptomyces roseoverticillatus]
MGRGGVRQRGVTGNHPWPEEADRAGAAKFLEGVHGLMNGAEN